MTHLSPRRPERKVAQSGDDAALRSDNVHIGTPHVGDVQFVNLGEHVREIFNPNGMYGRWNWRGLVAYFGGFTAMIPFFSTGIYRGPVAEALGGADIAMLVGLPVSTVIYLIACRSLDLEAEIRLVKIADQGLDPDA